MDAVSSRPVHVMYVKMVKEHRRRLWTCVEPGLLQWSILKSVYKVAYDASSCGLYGSDRSIRVIRR